jgi:hypothetical protein
MSRHMHYIFIALHYLTLRSYERCRTDSLPDSVLFYKGTVLRAPILIAEQCKSWICSRSLSGIAVSNRIEDMVVSLLGLLRVDR